MDDDFIAKLSPQERIAGYMRASANLAYLGAQLRTKYKNVSTDYYEGWSEEEEKEWDDLADAIDPWYYGLKPEEHKWLEEWNNIVGVITRGENPCSVSE